MTRQCGDAVGSLTDDYPLSLTGESSRGGCKFLLDKCVDQRNDISKFCFGSLPSDGMKRGNAQTVLLKQYYQCDHGPEDHRGLADHAASKEAAHQQKAARSQPQGTEAFADLRDPDLVLRLCGACSL